MGTPWGKLVVRESPGGKSDAPHTRESLVWTQEQGNGDAELAVRATSCPWETLCGGQSHLSCGGGCVSGNSATC